MRRLTFVFGATLSCALVLAGVPQAYVLSGHYWGTSAVNYFVNPSNRDMSQQAAIASLQAAAANWSEQSTANVHFVYAGTTPGSSIVNNGKNEVFFRNASKGSTGAETYWWYGSTGKLLDADMVIYDAGFKFFPGSSGCSSGIYLEDLATHEFGHALGVKHSSVTSATMYPTIPSWCSQSWRVLDADDVSAVQKAYPGSTGSSTTTSLPAIPRSYLPLNLSSGVTLTTTMGSYLRWYAAARATSYDVYFGTSSNPPKIATVIPPAGVSVKVIGTMYQAVTRASKTTYYWRIVAKNSAGSTTSAVWKFTTL
jgi:Matrixin